MLFGLMLKGRVVYVFVTILTLFLAFNLYAKEHPLLNKFFDKLYCSETLGFFGTAGDPEWINLRARMSEFVSSRNKWATDKNFKPSKSWESLVAQLDAALMVYMDASKMRHAIRDRSIFIFPTSSDPLSDWIRWVSKNIGRVQFEIDLMSLHHDFDSMLPPKSAEYRPLAKTINSFPFFLLRRSPDGSILHESSHHLFFQLSKSGIVGPLFGRVEKNDTFRASIQALLTPIYFNTPLNEIPAQLISIYSDLSDLASPDLPQIFKDEAKRALPRHLLHLNIIISGLKYSSAPSIARRALKYPWLYKKLKNSVHHNLGVNSSDGKTAARIDLKYDSNRKLIVPVKSSDDFKTSLMRVVEVFELIEKIDEKLQAISSLMESSELDLNRATEKVREALDLIRKSAIW